MCRSLVYPVWPQTDMALATMLDVLGNALLRYSENPAEAFRCRAHDLFP